GSLPYDLCCPPQSTTAERFRERPMKALKLLVILKMHHELSLARRRLLDFDLHSERQPQLLLKRRDLLAAGLLFPLCFAPWSGQQIVFAIFFEQLLADDPLHIANAQLFAPDLLAHFDLLAVIAERQ